MLPFSLSLSLCLSLSLSKDAEIPDHDDGISFKSFQTLTKENAVDRVGGNLIMAWHFVIEINNLALLKERMPICQHAM